MPRRVYLVDDDELLRDFASLSLVDAGYEVVPFESGQGFLDKLDPDAAGCVLLDIHMPGLSGLEVQGEMNARGLTWPVVVLTGQGAVRLAVEAMKNGAFEFLQKPYEVAPMLAVLDDAFAKLDAEHEEAARTAKARTLVSALSPRELQVLRGLLAGLPSKLIAHELGLSTRTVEIYRGNVMDKLGARSLSAAVRLALNAGLQPLGETEA